VLKKAPLSLTNPLALCGLSKNSGHMLKEECSIDDLHYLQPSAITQIRRKHLGSAAQDG